MVWEIKDAQAYKLSSNIMERKTTLKRFSSKTTEQWIFPTGSAADVDLPYMAMECEI